MNDPRAELEALLVALLEDGASPAQRERLGQLLGEHPAMRSGYVRQMRVHALLQFAAGRSATCVEPRVVAKLERVKEAAERWKGQGRDLARVREFWSKVGPLTQSGRWDEAERLVDQAFAALGGSRAAPE